MENKTFNVYCEMNMTIAGSGTCGDGGWTLVMKIDGSKVALALIGLYVHYMSENDMAQNCSTILSLFVQV